MSRQSTPSYNFVIKQGATFSRTIKFRNQDTGALISLDDLVSAKLTIRPRDSTSLIELVSGGPSDRNLTIDYVNKKIRIYIADEVTANYTWNRGMAMYDLYVTDSAGEVKRKLHGEITLEKRVT